MKTTIELLKDAIDDNGMTVDETALFELLDTTLCDVCCDYSNGGNGACKPGA